jgi:hypothetical protein
MNESEIILKATNFQRKKNFQEDIKLWKKIADMDIKDPNIKIMFTEMKKTPLKFIYKEVVGKFKNGNQKFKADGAVQKMLASLSSKIMRVNKDNYKIKNLQDLKLWMIKDYANIIYDTDKKLQIHFCRDPSRQSFAEKVQIAMLKGDVSEWIDDCSINGVNQNYFTVKKLKKEQIVSRGKILNPKNSAISKKQTSRSLDVLVESQSIKAYGTIKYSEPIGGLTTDLQPGEEKDFIKEFNVYCENLSNENDNVIFFVQTDGTAAELAIPELRELVDNTDRVFVGTTFQVIKWINSKISN